MLNSAYLFILDISKILLRVTQHQNNWKLLFDANVKPLLSLRNLTILNVFSFALCIDEKGRLCNDYSSKNIWCMQYIT